MADVELKGVSKEFMGGTVPALRDIHLTIPDGTFSAILGPSGCGKTTLLRIVAGLEQPDAGEVLIGGRMANHIPPAERNVAMVFQNYALYPHKRVFDNIAIGLKFRRVPKKRIKEKVEEVSRILEIEDLMRRYPKQLSGGQQQRVALARALVREPEVFLLDEPLSNLDAQVRDATRSELKKLFRDLNATVLYVTHDQTEAMMMSDFLVVMDKGAIRQAGEPTHIYKDPTHRFVAEFIGTPRINMVAGRLQKGKFVSTDASIVFHADLEKEGEILMGIRPEQLAPGNQEDVPLKGKTVLIEPMGPTNLVSLKVGENELKMFLPHSPEVGEPLNLSFSRRHAYFFDAESGHRLKSGA
jgi:ABC-type sugar transport system ATPase subunit